MSGTTGLATPKVAHTDKTNMMLVKFNSHMGVPLCQLYF